MNKQQILWKGDFGNHYFDRNYTSDEMTSKRKDLFRPILNTICDGGISPPKTILEVGAGGGQNLIALSELYDENGKKVKLKAVDINSKACDYLETIRNVTRVDCAAWEDVDIKRPVAELVFTSGVLIHVHPTELKKFMDKIVMASEKYVVCIEYFSPECREIRYRGHFDSLWANDFGSLYLHGGYGLKLMGYFFFWKSIYGVDNLTCFVFEKGN